MKLSLKSFYCTLKNSMYYLVGRYCMGFNLLLPSILLLSFVVCYPAGLCGHNGTDMVSDNTHVGCV